MKKVLLILCLFYFTFGFTQVKTAKKITDINVTSLKFSTTSIKDLKSINWQQFQFLYEQNKEKEFIELEVELDLPNSKNKFKSSVKVKGERKNIKELIKRMEKLTKGLIKLAKKYNHEK